MMTITSINELHATLNSRIKPGQRLALVPTMGNLHEGHLSLVDLAYQYADYVLVSIFVNPLQFGVNEDFSDYPRTLDADKAKLNKFDIPFIFVPSIKEIYPRGPERQTYIEVPELSERFCGAHRPGHFRGVATVVTKLLNIVQPDVAIFGEKDFQQLQIIRRMADDLCLPIEIISGRIVRHQDGLAMSSRNVYLTSKERACAPNLYQTLKMTRDALLKGQQDYASLEAAALDQLREAGFDPDYFSICEQHSLNPAKVGDDHLVILAAAHLGKTRLIDNVTCQIMRFTQVN